MKPGDYAILPNVNGGRLMIVHEILADGGVIERHPWESQQKYCEPYYDVVEMPNEATARDVVETFKATTDWKSRRLAEIEMWAQCEYKDILKPFRKTK